MNGQNHPSAIAIGPRMVSSFSDWWEEEAPTKEDPVLMVFSNLDPIPQPVISLESRLEQLTSKIFEDCKYSSSPQQIAAHPSYQVIIREGVEALPFLSKKLKESPTFWFVALQKITGTDPVSPDHKGRVSLMVDDWNRWLRDKNYA